MRYTLLILAILALAVPASSAPSYLGGISGNIITPDSLIVPAGDLDLSYHQISDFIFDDNLSAIGITYGVVDNLEVGASFISNGDTETALNAKYRLLPETAARPAIIIGVFDAFGAADELDSDPGFYFLLSKNVTGVASEIVDEPSRPLRLSVGFGTGVYDGLFAGFDWTLEPRLSLMAEFTSADIGGESDAFNVGFRWAASPGLRLDAALIDFDDLAFGASWTTRFGTP